MIKLVQIKNNKYHGLYSSCGYGYTNLLGGRSFGISTGTRISNLTELPISLTFNNAEHISFNSYPNKIKYYI